MMRGQDGGVTSCSVHAVERGWARLSIIPNVTAGERSDGLGAVRGVADRSKTLYSSHRPGLLHCGGCR